MIPAYFLCGTTFPHSPRYRSAREAESHASRGLERFFFEGTTFPHSSRPRRALRSSRPEVRGVCCFFSTGTTFPYPLVSRDAIDRTPTISGRTPSLALRGKEIAKFWQYGKWERRRSHSF